MRSVGSLALSASITRIERLRYSWSTSEPRASSNQVPGFRVTTTATTEGTTALEVCGSPLGSD